MEYLFRRQGIVVIFINGSFGIGKTTVARLLRDRLPGSVVFDPEPIGLVLQYLARQVPLDGDTRMIFRIWRCGAGPAYGAFV